MSELIGICGEYGIAIGSIVCIIYVVKLFVGVIKNHLDHSTQASLELSKAIKELIVYLKQNSEEIKRFVSRRED